MEIMFTIMAIISHSHVIWTRSDQHIVEPQCTMYDSNVLVPRQSIMQEWHTHQCDLNMGQIARPACVKVVTVYMLHVYRPAMPLAGIPQPPDAQLPTCPSRAMLLPAVQ